MDADLRKKLIVRYDPRYSKLDELEMMFRNVGSVESIQGVAGFQSTRRKFLYVIYNSAYHARRALRILNRRRVNSSMVKIIFAYALSTSVRNTSLYITNLPNTCTEEELINLFKHYGKIVSVKIIYSRAFFANRNIFISEGVACVRFSFHHEAVDAVLALDRYSYSTENADRIIRIRFSKPTWMRSKDYTPYFLFVYNFPPVQESTVKRVFEHFGTVEAVTTLNINGPGPKCLVVKMISYDAAQKAVATLHNLVLYGQKIEVYF